MRILELNSARKYIGEAAHTLNLTEALRRRGQRVWLGLREGYNTFERAAARGLDPIGFHMPHRWWPPQDLHDIRRIAELVRTEKIELIHAHRGKDHWQASLAVKMYKLGVPVLRTRHVVTPLSANAANRWLARRTAVLITVSRAVLADVERTGLYTGARLAFIPGGIDLELFQPASVQKKIAAREKLGLPAASIVAMCVARFAIVKAHRVLLEAWREVQTEFPAARLVLVGGGPLLEQSRAQAAELGVADHVLFAGRRYDVPELLDAADLGVLSSVGSEGFSRAVLEYMAKGLPTVGTRVGAVPDLIDDGVHGRLVPPENAGALAAALKDTIRASATQRAEWGGAARAKAARDYGYASWAAAHERLYAQVWESEAS